MAKGFNFPKVTVDPEPEDEDQAEESEGRSAPRSKRKVVEFSDVSRAQFVDALNQAVERMGGHANGGRYKVAERLNVYERYIYRWEQGLGPSVKRMSELIDKLQTMEP